MSSSHFYWAFAMCQEWGYRDKQDTALPPVSYQSSLGKMCEQVVLKSWEGSDGIIHRVAWEH